jgi:hypothetical protein
VIAHPYAIIAAEHAAIYVLAWVDAFYGRDELAAIAASSWPEWPQTIFPGQMRIVFLASEGNEQ